MKKSLVALAVLAASGAVMAQSSVTLFGVADVSYSGGSGSVSDKTQLKKNGIGSSRIGFRGVEDLGGGLKASFWYEADVGPDDATGAASSTNNQATGAASPTLAGSQGLTFNRRSTVSLEGGMGEARLGRDYTPQFWSTTEYDPFGTNGVGSNAAAGKGGLTNTRASNSIAWLSPTMGGFKVWAQTYMGENASTAPKAGNGNAIRLTYNQGAVSLAYATAKTTTGAGTEMKSSNIAGSYDLGVAKLTAMTTKDDATGQAVVDGSLVGVLVPMAGGTFKLSMSQTEKAGATSKQTAVGFVKPLSKRTSLYATYARVGNSGGASLGLNGAITGVNASSTGYDFGVNHSF